MTPRQILLSTALILVLAGLIFGMSPHSAKDQFETDSNCGSLFVSSSDVTEQTAAGCKTATDGAKPLVYGAFGLAVVAFIAAFVAPTPTRERAEPNP